jgi:hypothetical protein
MWLNWQLPNEIRQLNTRMHLLRRCCAVLVVSALTTANGQLPQLEPGIQNEQPVPRVSFEFLFPAAGSHYAISVESTGRAAYVSDQSPLPGSQSLPSPQSSGTPYTMEFTVSPATASLIFNLARRAHYFQGDFESNNRVAESGTKTLTYSEGPAVSFGRPTVGVRNSASYNYSNNPAIQQLTEIFQGIASSAELGRRLDYLHRFDKLGLDAALKRAEQMAQEKQLLELQTIAPSLNAIANDASVINSARKRAQKLLAQAQR